VSGTLAVDLGSSRTLVADSSGRILVDEPTVAVVNLRDGSLVAFGAPAVDLPGRAAGELQLVHPVDHGQLQDLALTDQVAELLLRRVRRRVGRRPEVLCSVPGLASGVQRRALERSFSRAGASHVDFIEHAVAAGIGFRLHIDEPVATMVVDAGAGTTDVAVMALGGVVTEASLPVGGSDLDRAIREMCLRSHDLLLSPAVAEQVKLAIATAWPAPERKVEVSGRDSSNGMVRSVAVSSSEVAAAIDDPVRAMVGAAVKCIVEAPPDLANDLLSRGLHLAGEGGLLGGFTRRLATETGIPVHVAERPGEAAVLGAARCQRDLSGRRPGTAAATRSQVSRPKPEQS
jgi:rod shape-determining protein MreB